MFCVSSSWCCGLVCSVWLGYFLAILLYFFGNNYVSFLLCSWKNWFMRQSMESLGFIYIGNNKSFRLKVKLYLWKQFSSFMQFTCAEQVQPEDSWSSSEIITFAKLYEGNQPVLLMLALLQKKKFKKSALKIYLWNLWIAQGFSFKIWCTRSMR